MKTLTIQGSLRAQTGKKESKKLRNTGNVPCVMYGGSENIHFIVHENKFKNLVYSSDVYLVKLQVDGQQYDAVMKDIQFHPVTDRIQHVDFVKVVSDKKVVLKLPIRLTGSSIGLKNGGKLRQRRRTIKIRALVEHIPDFLEVDMTNVEIGDYLKISDLSYEHIQILDPPRAMVVGVVSSRLVAKGFREAVAEEAAAEVAAEAAAEGKEEGEAQDEEEGK